MCACVRAIVAGAAVCWTVSRQWSRSQPGIRQWAVVRVGGVRLQLGHASILLADRVVHVVVVIVRVYSKREVEIFCFKSSLQPTGQC